LPLSDSRVYVLRFQHRLDSFPESLCIYGKIRSVLIWRVCVVYGERGWGGVLWESMGVYIPMLVFKGYHQLCNVPMIRILMFGFVDMARELMPLCLLVLYFRGFQSMGQVRGGTERRSRPLHPGNKRQLIAVCKCAHVAQNCLRFLTH